MGDESEQQAVPLIIKDGNRMKTLQRLIILLVLINIYFIGKASNDISDKLENVSEWIDINNNISIRFICDSSGIFPEIKSTNLSGNKTTNSEENIVVIFKDEDNAISQFQTIRHPYTTEKSENILCKGNSNFFLNNRISTIFFKIGDNLVETHLSDENSIKLIESYKNLKKTSEKKILRTKKLDYNNRISLGYEHSFLNNQPNSLHGVTLQYVHGFKVTKKPIFIETGVGVSFNFIKYNRVEQYYNGYDRVYSVIDERWLNDLTVNIPLNISYKLKLKDEFSIQPYTGINFKLNPIFDYSYSWSEQNRISNDENYSSYCNEYTHKNMFQMDWHIGFGFNISKLYIGLQYGIDLLPKAIINKYEGEMYNGNTTLYNESEHKLRSSNLMISLGFNF